MNYETIGLALLVLICAFYNGNNQSHFRSDDFWLLSSRKPYINQNKNDEKNCRFSRWPPPKPSFPINATEWSPTRKKDSQSEFYRGYSVPPPEVSAATAYYIDLKDFRDYKNVYKYYWQAKKIYFNSLSDSEIDDLRKKYPHITFFRFKKD